MKISGFSFAWNAEKLHYPVVEAIRSILPICDEFVIAIGRGEADDHTRELVAAIGDPKIRIIDTSWDTRATQGRLIYSAQTDIALHACRGDWCFYVQADEVVHEKYLPVIRRRCETLLDDSRIEGLLFSYKHFWGDYDHYLVNHHWYPAEVRIVRNGLGIGSRGDAQSFCRENRKLRVAPVEAEIFHYGWVRPPRVMQKRNYESTVTYHGKARADQAFHEATTGFDYGSLERLHRYTGSYPRVMRERIAACDWKDQLQYHGKSRVRHPHDRAKYRILTWLEQHLLGGRQIGGRHYYTRVRGVP